MLCVNMIFLGHVGPDFYNSLLNAAMKELPINHRKQHMVQTLPSFTKQLFVCLFVLYAYVNHRIFFPCFCLHIAIVRFNRASEQNDFFYD